MNRQERLKVVDAHKKVARRKIKKEKKDHLRDIYLVRVRFSSD